MSLKEKFAKWNEPKEKDSDIYAPGRFNPGLFRLDKQKLKQLMPQCFRPFSLSGSYAARWQGIETILNDGDMNPALVVSTAPLLVACYSGDFDAVVLLAFPQELGAAKQWTLGTKLIVTEFYDGPNWWRKANTDIDKGPDFHSRFKAVCPIVADLYTDNAERLARKKSEIPDEMWDRTYLLAMRYMSDHPGMARNGLDVGYKDSVDITTIRFDPKLQAGTE